MDPFNPELANPQQPPPQQPPPPAESGGGTLDGVGEVAQVGVDIASAAVDAGSILEGAGGCLEGCGGCSLAVLVALFFAAGSAMAAVRLLP